MSLIGALALVLFTFAGGLSTPAGAVVDDPDVDTAASYRYVVNPEAGLVEVTVNLSVTADKPNQNLADGSFYEFFFDGYFFVIPGEAEGLTVTDSAGRDLNYSVAEEGEDYQVLDIDFRRNIFYRQTSTVVLDFTLAGDDLRTDELARINEAYAGFSVWVDPQLEEASIEVIVPDGFENDSTGTDRFNRERTEDNNLRFYVDDIDPEEYWAIASLSRESSLVSTELRVDGHEIEIRSWPGDDIWTSYVVDSMETGLPMLIDRVGLDWPIEDELTVVESYSPYILGFAGWYDPVLNEIEIGDELDEHVVFHELSHVWFNDRLFDARWITEGLADEFGAAVVADRGDQRPEPPEIDRVDPTAQPLNEWQDYSGDLEAEEWAYGASWTVTSAVVEHIGIDALAEVVQAVANDEISYVGDGAPEADWRQQDWRRYLDLIENRGEVDDEEITDLFVEWVLTDQQALLLTDRADSRTAYGNLNEAGSGWAPPLAVRSALTEWRFDVADEAIATANELLEQRDDLVSLMASLDASIPADLETQYEEAEDFDVITKRLAEVSETGQALIDADTRVKNADGLFERVGTIGTDFPADLAAGVVAFESGEMLAAAGQAAALDDEVDGLATAGMIRVGVAVGFAVLMLVLAFWLVRRRRRSRPSAATPVFPAT